MQASRGSPCPLVPLPNGCQMNIVLTGVLQKYTSYQREHCIAADTVREGIDALAKTYPGLNSVLFDQLGQLRRTHIVFLNGSQLGTDQLERRVERDDRIEILTAIAGG